MKNSTLKKLSYLSMAAFAATPIMLASSTFADSSAGADINLTIGEVISLNLDKSELNLSAMPNSFVKGKIGATVSTNAQYGYTLTLEDADDNTNMVHENSNVSNVFSSGFSGPKTSSTMENNTWGYSLNETDFFAVPVNGESVALKRAVNTGAVTETTDVSFGAKVGNATAGKYSDKVVFTVYVNGQNGKLKNGTRKRFAVLNTMQNFSCQNLENVGDMTTLMDSRDGSLYNVAKLADGKCWMIENLRLLDKTITSEDSDIAEGTTHTVPASAAFPFVNPADSELAVKLSNDEVFYTWTLATAGEGNVDTPFLSTVEHSICPKGWRLPTGGVGGEYETLYNLYGPEGMRNDVPGFGYPGSAYGEYDIDRNGAYWTSTTGANHSGSWTANGGVITTASAYNLYMYKDSSGRQTMTPTAQGNGNNGESIRCVMR